MGSQSVDIIELQYAIAVNRSAKAYGVLFLRYYKPLTRFALSILKSREAAEEVYSDVMLKLWDLGYALNKIENLQVYLYISVKNASLNYLAKYHKMEVVDIDAVDIDVIISQRSCEHEFLEREFTEAVSSAIASLPVKCRLVYQLIKQDGLSYRQTAEVLEISVNTVEGHMSNALKKITHSLQVYLRAGNN